jgi:hypothetical protein
MLLEKTHKCHSERSDSEVKNLVSKCETQMLRAVYPERSERAQRDKTGLFYRAWFMIYD